jgi:predicted acetyltransferase
MESPTVSIQIRNARPDEFADFIDAAGTGFLDRPDSARIATEAVQIWDPARVWAAFEDGRICGTFRSWGTEITVPGGARLPASAVAAVSVKPTHRRRGILSSLAAAEHAAIRERGELFGLLYASEYPIYGRFGYGPGSRVADWTLQASHTGFVGRAVSGVELITPDEAAASILKDVFDAWRAGQAGELRRRDFTWLDAVGIRESGWGPSWKGFIAVHRGPSGEPDGYARYRGEEKFVDRQPASTIRVNELHALNDVAYAALWRFLAEVDLVTTVIAPGRSPSERLPWLLTNARAAVPGEIGDGLWVRLFDVAGALAARRYEREDGLVLEVVDAELGPPVRVALDATPDGATCVPTDGSPDLTLPIAALGAAYLGGTRLRDATIASGMDEHTPGALARADALLRTADEPWCSTFF